MFSGLIETISRWGGFLLIAAAFGLSFGESAVLLDLVIPGEAGMVIVGAAARQSNTPVVLVILAGTIGAVLGDSVGFLLGRRFGTELVGHWKWTRKRFQPKIERAHDYFERKGGKAIFIGRWVGALRAVVPAVAGSAHMPYHRFLLWDVPAAASWMTAVVLAGYFLGQTAAEQIDRLGGWLSIVVITGLALYVGVRAWRKRHGYGDEDEGSHRYRGGAMSRVSGRGSTREQLEAHRARSRWPSRQHDGGRASDTLPDASR